MCKEESRKTSLNAIEIAKCLGNTSRRRLQLDHRRNKNKN